MDLVAACDAFVAVSRRGSFTDGAAERGIPQSVASKRIASLEHHLGGQLLNRSTRRVELTGLGRALLPTASMIVSLADGLRDHAKRQLLQPVAIMMPASGVVGDLARIVLAAAGNHLALRVETADPAERGEKLRIGQAEFAVQPSPPADSLWQVELGVAIAYPGLGDPIELESIRIRRGEMSKPPRKLWLQTEDDVPHVRDRITRLAYAISLQPGQLQVADTMIEAITGVTGNNDLLLCSQLEADHLELHWHPIRELHLVRGYSLMSRSGDRDTELLAGCEPAIARALGGRRR